MTDLPSLSDLRGSYAFRCTLSYGDIYGQILLWLLVSFLSLAGGAALAAAGHPLGAAVVVGLGYVLSLPFLLFAFITTLFSHITLEARDGWPQAQDIP